MNNQVFLSTEPILKYQHLTVAVSWQCNAHCSHCCIPRDERRRKTYQHHLVDTILDSLPSAIQHIGFTGGEPFLDPARFVREVEKVGRTGRTSSVVTNGLWLTSGKKVDCMLREAYQAGLRRLSISYDCYHQPQLDRDRVVDTIRLAREIGLQANMKGVGKGSANLISSIEESGVFAAQKYTNNLHELDNIGEATELPIDWLRGHRLKRCISVMSPFVSPYGEVYACCSSRTFEIRNDILRLGNVNRTSLSEILDKAARDYLLVALFVLGPKALYKVLNSRVRIDRSRHQCDLCVSLLNDTKKIEKLMELIAADRNFRKKLVGMYLIYERYLDVVQW